MVLFLLDEVVEVEDEELSVVVVKAAVLVIVLEIPLRASIVVAVAERRGLGDNTISTVLLHIFVPGSGATTRRDDGATVDGVDAFGVDDLDEDEEDRRSSGEAASCA